MINDMKRQRTSAEKAYDIYKSIVHTFEGPKSIISRTNPEVRKEHFKKLGKECVESGRIVEVSRKGGQTVTEKKLETIRTKAKERRKFTDEQVLEMKELYKNDITIDFPFLAEKYDCSIAQMSLIMNGHQYSDVGDKVQIRPALFKCPHCDIPPMTKSNLTKHHGDKCKLKDIDTNKIRKEYSKGGTSFIKLSKKYGLTPSMIDKIVNQK